MISGALSHQYQGLGTSRAFRRKLNPGPKHSGLKRGGSCKVKDKGELRQDQSAEKAELELKWPIVGQNGKMSN